MKRILFYIIFAGIAVAFFLYSLFPKEPLADYIEYQVYRLDPDFHLTIGDLRLSYPPYAKVDNLTVYYKKMPILTVSSARVRPGLGVIMKNGTIVAFRGKINEGYFSGKINREGSAAKGLLAVEVDLDGIQLEDIDGLRAIPGLNLAGRADGKIVHSRNSTQPFQGEADLVFSNCDFRLTDSPLGIKHLRFSRIETELILDGRELKIQGLEMTGPQINARFNGTVAIKLPLDRSQLDLTGKVKLHAAFMAQLKKKIPAPLWPDQRTLNDGLPVSIAGMVRKPQLSIK